LRTLILLRTDKVSNIAIRDSTFAGPTITGGHPQDGYAHGAGWFGGDIENAIFTNNELTNLRAALSLRRTAGVRIAGNSIHDYRADAIYITHSQDVTIADNRMSDPRAFRLPKGQGDHPDFIQMRDITGGVIENNYMDAGIKGGGSQGIFAGGTSRNLVVRNNVIASRMANALTFAALENSEIANNLVVNAALPLHLQGAEKQPHEPRLPIRTSYRDVRVTGNVASRYGHDFEEVARAGQVTARGNLLVQNTAPDAPNYYHYDGEGVGAPSATMTRIGAVGLGPLPANSGPDPAKFAYLTHGTSRAPAACPAR